MMAKGDFLQTAVAVIPARYASTRFPGKPLADRTGKPLIQHIVERVQQCGRISQILVATDDTRIFDAVEAFGGQPVMTRADHPNGTSRIAEVVGELLPAGVSDLIVNVQGDEPEIEPAVIDQLVETLAADQDAPMATVACPFDADEEPSNPNLVKVVLDQCDRALYFTRAIIPYHRDRDRPAIAPLKHVGLYAYRRDFLDTYIHLPSTPLEQAEQLEQLRVLEHGHPIAVVRTATPAHPGIDTPEQYEAFVSRYLAASPNQT